MKIIALEESFWYEKLATEGSTVAHVRVKSAVATGSVGWSTSPSTGPPTWTGTASTCRCCR
jgi:hypothetical protein